MTQSYSRNLLMLIVLGLAAVVTACGGGGGDSETSQIIGSGDQASGELRVINTFTSPTQGASPLEVNFQVSIGGGEPPFDYFWDFNYEPGADSNAPERTLQNRASRSNSTQNTYRVRAEDAESGISRYNARIRVRDDNGNEVSVILPRPADDGTAQGEIVVGDQAAMMVDVEASSGEVQNGVDVFRTEREIDFQATVTGGNAPLSYAWDFENDGQVDSTLEQPTFIYSDPGEKTISLQVTGSGGETAGASLTIDVIPAEAEAPDVIPFVEEAVVLNSAPPLRDQEGRTFDGEDGRELATQTIALPAPSGDGGAQSEVLDLSSSLDPDLTEGDIPGEEDLDDDGDATDPNEQDRTGDGDNTDSVTGKAPHEFLWDFTSDGIVDFIGKSPTIPLIRNGQPFNPYSRVGDYLLTLRVKDQQGIEVEKKIEIRVGEQEEIELTPDGSSDEDVAIANADVFRPSSGAAGCALRSFQSNGQEFQICQERSLPLGTGNFLGDPRLLSGNLQLTAPSNATDVLSAGGIRGGVATPQSFQLESDTSTLNNAEWSSKNPLIVARGESASEGFLQAVGGGNVRLGVLNTGGRNEFAIRPNVSFYAPGADIWQEFPPIRNNGTNIPLFGHSMFVSSSGFYFGLPDQGPIGNPGSGTVAALLIGGATGQTAGNASVSSDVYLYNPGGFPNASNTAIPVSQIPTPRKRMAAARLNHNPVQNELLGQVEFPPRMILAGGENLAGDPVSTVEMLTPRIQFQIEGNNAVPAGIDYRWESLPDMPAKLTGADAFPTNFVSFRKDDLDGDGNADLIGHVIEGITVTGGSTLTATQELEPQTDTYFLAVREFDVKLQHDLDDGEDSLLVSDPPVFGNIQRIERWVEIPGAELPTPRYNHQAEPMNYHVWAPFETQDPEQAPQLSDDHPAEDQQEQQISIIGGVAGDQRVPQVDQLNISPGQ